MKIAKSKHYARLLVSLITEEKEWSVLIGKLNQFSAVVDKMPELKNFFDSKQVGFEDKKNLIQKNFGLKDVGLDFCLILVKNDRLNDLPAIIALANEFFDQEKGFCRVVVSSSIALDDSQVTSLSKVLKEKLNKKIIIENNIENEMSGGLMLRYENKEIDMTIAGKIKKVAKALNL